MPKKHDLEEFKIDPLLDFPGDFLDEAEDLQLELMDSMTKLTDSALNAALELTHIVHNKDTGEKVTRDSVLETFRQALRVVAKEANIHPIVETADE